jgi:adenylate cyclase
MAQEIERKFLVTGDGWRDASIERHDIRQGYLATGKRAAVRVRIANGRAILNIKAAVLDIARDEFEYEIPLHEGEAIVENLCEGAVIEKTRHVLEHQGVTWEVDEFHGANGGLIVAEVELESASQTFERPAWLGDEVSGDPRYLNCNLVHKPYREW